MRKGRRRTEKKEIEMCEEKEGNAAVFRNVHAQSMSNDSKERADTKVTENRDRDRLNTFNGEDE